jgi:hypothetical protein
MIQKAVNEQFMVSSEDYGRSYRAYTKCSISPDTKFVLKERNLPTFANQSSFPRPIAVPCNHTFCLNELQQLCNKQEPLQQIKPDDFVIDQLKQP